MNTDDQNQNNKDQIRVLIVDDDPDVVRITSRLLDKQDDITVVAVHEPAVALVKSRKMDFDVVLSDVMMPGMDGIKLIEGLRSFDLDVPIILFTGAPSVETAQKAVELGAYRYLIKPVDTDELLDVIRKAGAGYKLAKLKRQASELSGEADQRPGDTAGLQSALSSAMDSLWLAYQPIVKAVDSSLYGFEALLRSEQTQLSTPKDIIDAAFQLGQLNQLGRAVRDKTASEISRAPANSRLFINVHPKDLMDVDLGHPDARLTEVSARVILEISEHDWLEASAELLERLTTLRRLGFQFAVDDLGSGKAGLGGFKWLEPLIAKIDVELTTDIAEDSRKKDVVKSMVDLCHDNNIIVVAEGIETQAAMNTCKSLGCDLLQGFFIAEPGKPFPSVKLA